MSKRFKINLIVLLVAIVILVIAFKPTGLSWRDYLHIPQCLLGCVYTNNSRVI